MSTESSGELSKVISILEGQQALETTDVLDSALRRISEVSQRRASELKLRNQQKERIQREITLSANDPAPLQSTLSSTFGSTNAISASATSSGTFDENAYLRQQSEAARSKYIATIRQYEELYFACEVQLMESEAKRASLETQLRDLHMTGASPADGAKNRKTEQSLEKIKTNFTRSKFQLMDASRSLQELQRSIQNYIEHISARGVTPMSLKAGKLLSEQFKVEADGLQSLSENMGIPDKENTP
ncbi:MAG: hypothetical protein H7222_15930 [Methylotenera sp.]|nr:hypothetical protein [Oligoflexia bacterium]